MAANLETLELTINGSAKGASEGIDRLIHSLSELSGALLKPYSDLRDFNEELRKMKGYCNSIKLPNVAKFTGAKAAVSKAKKAINDYDPLTNNNRIVKNVGDPSAKPQEQWQKEYDANVAAMKKASEERRRFNAERRREIQEQAEAEKKAQESLAKVKQEAAQASFNAERAAMSQRGEDTQAIMEQSSKLDLLRLKQEALHMETVSMAREGKLTTKQIAERSMQYQKLGEQIDKLKEQMANVKEESHGINQATENIKKMEPALKKATSSAKTLWGQIGRIAKTMLIRSAIRSLMKAAKEGLDNFYQYSKAIGSEYYKSLDSVTSKWNQFKNQIGAALGTALQAILPIINAIASVAITAVNWITALFALLSGKTTYSKAVEGMDSYTDSAKGASKATKELLASFDELNVIQNQNSGSGSGVGGTSFKDMFQEVELPAWMVEWKPLIEAILGGVLSALILPKIWDWIKKIFDLFGGSGAKDTLDILKKMFKLKDTDFNTPTDGVDKFLKKFTDGDILDGVNTVTDLLDTLKNLDWKTLLIKNLPELLKLAITALTKLIEGLDVTSKVNVDRKEFDEYKKDFEKFKNENKILSVAVVFDHTRSSDFWRDKKTIDNWCNTLATKSVAFIVDHTRSSDFSKDKKTIDTWLKTVGVKSIAFVVDHTRSSDYTRDKKTIDTWLSKTGIKYIAYMIDHTRSSDFSKNKSAIDKWLDTVSTKTINIVFDTAKYLSYSLTVGAIDLWLARKDTKTINIVFDTVRLTTFNIYRTAIDKWVEKTDTKYVNVKIVDNNSVLAKTMEWIATEETKVVNVKVNTTTKVKDNNGNFWDKNIFSTSLEDALDYFNKNDLPTIISDFWTSFTNLFNNPKTSEKNIYIEVIPSVTTGAVQGAINFIQGFNANMKVNTYNTRQDCQATADAISTWVPHMKVDTYNTKEDVNETVRAIETWVPYLRVVTYNTAKDTKATIDAIETWVPTLKANVINTRENMQALMDAIETWHPVLTASVITEGDYTQLAEGGLVQSGDIFIANENGKSEMIGRFGTHAAVANQEQMVEAMARGVQYANAEQNALLRRQNELLVGILKKEGNVKIGASSALGRVATQSINMYERAMGV